MYNFKRCMQKYKDNNKLTFHANIDLLTKVYYLFTNGGN